MEKFCKCQHLAQWLAQSKHSINIDFYLWLLLTFRQIFFMSFIQIRTFQQSLLSAQLRNHSSDLKHVHKWNINITERSKMWGTVVSHLHHSLNLARSQDFHNPLASKQLNTTAIRVPSLKTKHHEGKGEELNKQSAEDLETVAFQATFLSQVPTLRRALHLA